MLEQAPTTGILLLTSVLTSTSKAQTSNAPIPDIIVVNDGSTDNSPEIVEKMRAAAPHITNLKRLATTYPQAKMLANAYGQILPNGQPRDTDFAHMPQGEHGLIDRYFLSMAHGAMPISSSSTAVCKQTMFAVNGFPEAKTHGEDRIFWAKMAQAGPVVWSRKETALYHLDTENRSTATWTPQKKASAYLKYLTELKENVPPGTRLGYDI